MFSRVNCFAKAQQQLEEDDEDFDLNPKRKGPFPHRATEPWRSLNRVKGVEGFDALRAMGETSEAPLELAPETLNGDLSGLKRKRFDLLIVGAGLSGAVLAERCSQELGMTSLVIDCAFLTFFF